MKIKAKGSEPIRILENGQSSGYLIAEHSDKTTRYASCKAEICKTKPGDLKEGLPQSLQDMYIERR